MAIAELNYYRSCGLQLIGTKRELDAYVQRLEEGPAGGRAAHGRRRPHRDAVRSSAPGPTRGLRIVGPAWGGDAVQRRHRRSGRPDRARRAAPQGDEAQADDPRPEPHGRPGGRRRLRAVARADHGVAQQRPGHRAGRPADHRCDGGRGGAPGRHARDQLLPASPAQDGARVAATTWCVTRCTSRAPRAVPSTSAWAPTWTEDLIRGTRRCADLEPAERAAGPPAQTLQPRPGRGRDGRELARVPGSLTPGLNPGRPRIRPEAGPRGAQPSSQGSPPRAQHTWDGGYFS